MMGKEQRNGKRASLRGLGVSVPTDHLLRRIDRLLDLGELRDALAPHYSSKGRPSIAPELLIRTMLIGRSYGIGSERRLCAEVRYNLAYRWFCRLPSRGRRAAPLDIQQEPARPLPRGRCFPSLVRAVGATLRGGRAGQVQGCRDRRLVRRSRYERATQDARRRLGGNHASPAGARVVGRSGDRPSAAAWRAAGRAFKS